MILSNAYVSIQTTNRFLKRETCKRTVAVYWSPWLCDSSRLLTIMSRYYRCLVVTALSLEGFSRRKPLSPAARDLCCAQQNATVHWTWSNTAKDLGLTNDDCNPPAVGQRWYDYASEHLERWNSTNIVDSTDAQDASPGAAQQSPQKPPQ